MTTASIPNNPLKRLRLKLGLTVEQLVAMGAGSRIFILNAEAGLYPNPPDRLYQVLQDEYSVLDYQEIQAEYHDWQTKTRRSNYGALKPEFFTQLIYTTVSNRRTDVHPFIAWREWSGINARIRTCKLFCIHPSTINRFEQRPWQVATVPSPIRVALIDAGYTTEVLDALDKAWVNYKEHLSNQLTVTPAKMNREGAPHYVGT